LERQFGDAGLETIIDDHSRFSGQLKRTVGRLVLLGLSLLAMIGIGATAVNIFATRAGLAAQRDIIHVLVQAGASDSFIARLFVGQAAKRGAVGAAVGALAAGLVWIFVSTGPGRDSVGWRGAGDAISDIIALAVLIGLFAFICAGAAGWAAMRQLVHERRRA
jgi:cell division transport system permease protein